jgi:SAM-dependent methyltransferase
LKPHDPLQPPQPHPETSAPPAEVDDGRAGRVPIVVSDGDFSTPYQRKRTITQPRGLRALEAPVDSTFVEATEPSRESVPTPPPLEAGLDSGMSAVDEFLTSPPTPAPEIELTPPPEASEPDLSQPALEELDLTPPPAHLLAREPYKPTTPLPEMPRFPPGPGGDAYAAAPESEDVTFESMAPVMGATPQPEVSAYPAPEQPNPVTPLLEDRGSGHHQGDEDLPRESSTREGFSAAETAEAELDAAVNAAIPDFRPGRPSDGSVPIVENASAGAEMRLAALGALPVTKEVTPDLGQVARDEAIVDDLLRRATEQMLGDHADSQSHSDPVAEVPPSTAALAPEPADMVGATASAPLPASSSRAPSLEGDASLEPSLSPLAQTLAHMAEALHSDLAADPGMDIDIVDAPLVSPARSARDPEHAPASPPPIPIPGVPTAAKAVPEQPPPGDAPVPEALEERPRRPRRSKPWYEEVFDENYLRTLPFMTPEQTLREVDYIEASLAAEKGSRILDVGCGYGRHAIELVQRGMAVTGLDLSLPLLIRAADESQKRALAVNFVHSDMRSLAFDSEFDSAYCMLTSFGYFDEETNLKVAEGIARSLKPGGRFLLDVVNRDYIVGDLPARIWWEGDGCVVLEEVEFNFNTSRILTHRSVVFEDGRQLDQEISVRAYSLHELGKLLRNAGFRVIEASGSVYTPGSFFGAASRNLLILAERRND